MSTDCSCTVNGTSTRSPPIVSCRKRGERYTRTHSSILSRNIGSIGARSCHSAAGPSSLSSRGLCHRSGHGNRRSRLKWRGIFGRARQSRSGASGSRFRASCSRRPSERGGSFLILDHVTSSRLPARLPRPPATHAPASLRPCSRPCRAGEYWRSSQAVESPRRN